MTTAKIKKVAEQGKRSYAGRNGEMFVHVITLETPINGVSDWEYHSTSPTCTKFVAGQDATFTTEVKQNGQYTNYKISPVAAVPSFGGGKSSGSQAKDEGRISALSAASSAATFYSNRMNATPEMMLDLAERIYQFSVAKSSK